jgi:hypothetical protein
MIRLKARVVANTTTTLFEYLMLIYLIIICLSLKSNIAKFAAKNLIITLKNYRWDNLPLVSNCGIKMSILNIKKQANTELTISNEPTKLLILQNRA